VGKLVLVKRGGCNYSVKVYQAQIAGAVAALVYQSGSGGTGRRRCALAPTPRTWSSRRS
jgi:hypothetical protein